MGLNFENMDGRTPIDEDEKEGLRITSISTLGELNEFEQLNIQKAVEWTLSRKFKREDILTEKFIKQVHMRMYGDVWKWAGNFRLSNKNIGVDKYEIGIQLRQLLNDVTYWIEHSTFSPDEIAIRFKHRLVSIHCFPNGNGRHSRLMADIIISHIFGLPVFTWGESRSEANETARNAYLAAVKKGDEGEFGPLISFARD